MCGIAGLASLSGKRLPDERQIRTMCDTIVHRGPDDAGYFVDGRVGLGMRRLSIIDLAGGHQPIFNEDRSVCTVFNGEIYNYRELRTELIRCGHRFKTQSDTEVIVHAYEEFGLDFPKHLNGMFGIAVYDRNRQRIILARDHIGIKPLYYYATPDHVVWGSEIKVLLASGLVERDLNIDALAQFLAWEYVPGEQTLLRGVSKLEAGHTLEIELDSSGAAPREFWDVATDGVTQTRSDADWEECVDEKIRECVNRQLVSDVPLGAFLSGGVDSSLIAAAMTEPVTFSIGFDDPSYNELAYSQQVAEHLGCRHVTETIEPRVVDDFDHLMKFMDDPIGDFSIFPTYLVSRLASQHVKVVLSGDGGDELFGGYETYLANDMARAYERIPRVLRSGIIEPVVNRFKPREAKKGLINKAKRFLEGQALPASLGHARWRLFLSAASQSQLLTHAAIEAVESPVETHIERYMQRARQMSHVNQALYVDVKTYLSDNILTKVDRMSMAVSIESRVPLLDKELVELAFSMPDRLKVGGRETKTLLKRVAARHVPRSCIYRQKEGFSIPIKNWLGSQFRPLMDELLSERRIRNEGLFQWNTIDTLKREHLAGTANHSHVLWALIVFESWQNKWLRN